MTSVFCNMCGTPSLPPRCQHCDGICPLGPKHCALCQRADRYMGIGPRVT